MDFDISYYPPCRDTHSFIVSTVLTQVTRSHHLIICGIMSTSIRFLCLLSVLLVGFVQAGISGHEHVKGLRHRSLHRRALAISPNLPANWSSKGCYSDNVNSRALNGKTYADGAMTQESCISFCSNNGYAYAGVEVCGIHKCPWINLM